VRLLKTRRQKVEHVEFGASGELLAQGYKECLLWTNPLNSEPATVISRKPCGDAQFCSNGDIVIQIYDGSGIHLVRGSDRRWDHVMEWPQNGFGHVVVSLVKPLFLVKDVVGLYGYAIESGGARLLWHVPVLFSDHSPSAVFRRSGSQLITCENRGGYLDDRWQERLFLVVRDGLTGHVEQEMSVRTPLVNQPACVSPDDIWLATARTAHIRILDLSADMLPVVKVIRNTGPLHFTAVAFHPSGHYLAATSNDATVKLYDTSNWQVARTFTWDVGRMRSIAFSPDGTLAAAGSDTGQIVVWDVDG
jgi:WD40 repeat protein